jgi:hypothetical protein
MTTGTDAVASTSLKVADVIGRSPGPEPVSMVV